MKYGDWWRVVNRERFVLMGFILTLLILFTAATVAIRYATVRRQGERGPDGLEKQIISYPSVYYRLLPILSRAYMFIHLGRTLVRSDLVFYNSSLIVLTDHCIRHNGRQVKEGRYIAFGRDACHDQWIEGICI